MARYKFQGIARDTWGNTKSNLDIYIYIAGTSRTTDAIIYTSESSGSTPLSAAPQVQTNSYGIFSFWVDDTDYTASETKFDLYASGMEYENLDIFNIKKHGTMGDLTAPDHPQYISTIEDTIVTSNWGFTEPVSGGSPTVDEHLATKLYVDSNASAFDPSQDQTITGLWEFSYPVSGATPTSNDHLATKLYVDTTGAAFDPTADETISGDWQFTEPVSGAEPTLDDHLATKLYVDSSTSNSNVISAGDSYVQVTDTGTGQVETNVDGGTSVLSTPTTTELYYAGTKSLETAAGGVNIYDQFGSDFSVTFSATNAIIRNNSGPSFEYKDNANKTVVYWDHSAGNYGFYAPTTGNNHLELRPYNASTSIVSEGDGLIFSLLATDSTSVEQNILVGDPDGATELYYAGIKTFETTSNGININSNAPILHDGSGLLIRNEAHGGRVYIQSEDDSGTRQTLFYGDPDEETKIYHDGNSRLETTTTGTGGILVRSDTNETFELYWSGGIFYVDNMVDSAHTIFRGNNSASANTTLALFDPDSSSELYYAGDNVLSTIADGITIKSSDGLETGSIAFDETTGFMYIRSLYNAGGVILKGRDAANQSKNLFQGYPGSYVRLYANNYESLRTNANGILVYGANASKVTYMTNESGSDNFTIRNYTHSGNIILASQNVSGANVTMVLGDPDGAADLYYAGTKTFETVTNGGTFPNGILNVGGATGNYYAQLGLLGSTTTSNGGTMKLYTADSNKGIYDNFALQVWQNDMFFGPNTMTNALQFYGSNSSWRFNSGIVIAGSFGSVKGDLQITGTTTGADGGMLTIFLCDDYDDTIDSYIIQAQEDDLYIGPDTNIDALKFDGANNSWQFTTPVSGLTPTVDEHLATKAYVDSGGGGTTSDTISAGNSYVKVTDTGTGQVETNVDGNTSILSTTNQTELYYAGTLAVQTMANGIQIFDGVSQTNIFQASIDFVIRNNENSGDVFIQGRNSSSTLFDMIAANPDNGITLKHSAAEMLSTRTDGINIAENAMTFRATGGITYWRSHGHGDPIRIEAENTGGTITPLFVGDSDAATELYYAGIKAFETTATGVDITDSASTAHLDFTSGNFQIDNLGGASIYLKQSGTLHNIFGPTLHRFYISGNKSFEIVDKSFTMFDPTNTSLKVKWDFENTSTFNIDNQVVSSTFSLLGRTSADASVSLFLGDPDGATELYYAGTKVAETLSNGWQSERMRINDGTRIGEVYYPSSTLRMRNTFHGGDIEMTAEDTGGSQRTVFLGDPDGSVDLYYAGTKTFETTSTGVEVLSGGTATAFKVDNTGATELYHTGTKVFNTAANGVEIGIDDSQYGRVDIFGNGASSPFGGNLNIYPANDYDGKYDHFAISVYQDDFGMGPVGDTKSLYYDSANDNWRITAPAGLIIDEYLSLLERSSDPTQPAEGQTIIWMSDGTGKGDDGDVMIAGTAGGTTNYTTLFDHSAGTTW